MHSVFSYGKFLVRTVIGEFSADLLTSHWLGNNNNRLVSTFRRRSFHLVTALSGISKTQMSPLSSNFAPSISHINQRSFGDDSCFVARHHAGDVLGVADGVGGWRTYGVDPSKFSRSLMSICERLVEQGKIAPQQPVDLLTSSYQELQEQKTSVIGSCTACIVALSRDTKKIYTANLGDSGFMVIRSGRVVHRSEEQSHYFNTPYQMALAPSVMEGMFICDRPDSASSSTFGVEEGDLILLGTDGLFDNLREEVILKHVSELKSDSIEDLQKVANRIASEAHELAFDPNYMSPFAVGAAANGYDVTGGKPDDITVLLAIVTSKNEPTSPDELTT